MRRRESMSDASATTAGGIARTQSLPEQGGSSKRRWRRRDSITDKLFGKFNKKKEEPPRSRSQSVGSVDPLRVIPEPIEAAEVTTPPLTPPKDEEERVRIKKRVGFHPSVLAVDPPQQIPPLNPRKGCVEIVNGEVKGPSIRQPEVSEYAYIDPSHSTITAFAAKRAHENASRLHSSLQKGGFLGLFKDEEEPIAKIKVDGESPGAHHIEGGAHCMESSQSDEYYEEELDDIVEDATPEQIYTRCCHLREILPIKSMLKQLQNQVAPIPELHIVNVKPTLIELLAFTDFVRIMPVVWIRMDSLVLSDEMVHILLRSLLTSTHLSKLSFCNTPLSSVAWAELCKFVELKGLISLDVSCAKDTRIPEFNRIDVDWKLLSKALQATAVDSIVLAGTLIPLEHWKNLAVSATKSLVMANNKLDREYIRCIVEFLIRPESECVGIDLSGNDLSSCYDLLAKLFKEKAIRRFNATNTCLKAKFFDIFDQNDLALRSLEVSDNRNLFSEGDIAPLVDLLPRLTSIRRLEVNNCNLTSATVVTLCQALVRCPTLVHLSLQGVTLNDTAAAALCVVVHTSKSLSQVDVDTECWPETFKHQLTAYCIQNINGEHKGSEIHSFEHELKTLQHDIHNAQEIPAHVLDKIVSMRHQYRQQLAELLRLRQTRALEVSEQETMFKLLFYDSSIERVIAQYRQSKREPATREPTHDVVYTFDTPRQGLSRAGSSTSIKSLKQLETEEGTIHKINTWLMSDAEINRESLKDLIDANDLSEDTLQRIKEYNATDLDREIHAS